MSEKETTRFSIDANNTIREGDREVAWLYHGLNGGWWVLDLGLRSHAYPVGSTENVRGTGCRTRRAAFEDWLAEIK
jgi:hypothetical protein